VRNRADVASPNLRKPEMLPPREIGVAVRAVIGSNLGASREEVVQSVARAFGFKATSTVLRDLIGGVIDDIVGSGGIVPKGDLLVLAEPDVARAD